MKETTVHTERLPVMERKTSPPRTIGIPKKTSVTRERSASHAPPKNPASPPSRLPRTATPSVEQTPTVTDVRAP